MMKQDVEILESHLRESPYIRIISNHAENDHDEEDLGFEDYEDQEQIDIAQQQGSYNSPYQQQEYDNPNQPFQGYGGHARFPQQEQQHGYQRQQGQTQAHHQQQAGFYQQGSEFQQQTLPHMKAQSGQGYPAYEQDVAQGALHHPGSLEGSQGAGFRKQVQTQGAFKQQHILNQQGQTFNQATFKGNAPQAGNYGVQAQPSQSQGYIQPQHMAQQGARGHQNQPVDTSLQHHPQQVRKQPQSMVPQAQKDIDFEMEHTIHPSGYSAGKVGTAGFQNRGNPQQWKQEQDSMQLSSHLSPQVTAGASQNQTYPINPQQNFSGGNKPTLNNPPNQYYQKPRQEYYGGKGPYPKQGAQPEKFRQQGPGSHYTGGQQQREASFGEFPQQQHSGDSGSYYSSQYQSSAQSIEYASGQQSYQSINQQGGYNNPQQGPDQTKPNSKKYSQQIKPANQPVPVAQQQSGVKKQPGARDIVATNQASYTPSGPIGVQHSGSHQLQQQGGKKEKDQRRSKNNQFDDNIMEVPRTISDQIKTVTDDQLGSSSWINTNVPYEKFIDDTVENVNRKPGFNRQKKKFSERQKKLEEYLQQMKEAGKSPYDDDDLVVIQKSTDKEGTREIKPFEGKKMELDFGDSASSASSHEEQQKIAGLAQVEEGEEEYPDIDSSDRDSDENEEDEDFEDHDEKQLSSEQKNPSRDSQKVHSKSSAKDSQKESNPDPTQQVKHAEVPTDS